MKINNVLIGPFLGDFRSEIIDFRPYTRWVYEVLKPAKMFVATHSNRSFLYDWATVLPVFEDFSRDELNQNGFMHNFVSQKDLNIVIKKIKSDMVKQTLPEKDFVHLTTLYSKNVHWFPLYKKIYSQVDMGKKKNNTILFIPNIGEKYAVVKDIYDFLCEKYGDTVVVAGDMKIHLHENNIMLKNPTYFTDVYYDVIKLISESKVVITPNSHWTVLALVQKTPVFSWGLMAKYFSNDTNHMLLHENVPTDYLKKMMEVFINNIK